jgi:hypothetical protein
MLIELPEDTRSVILVKTYVFCDKWPTVPLFINAGVNLSCSEVNKGTDVQRGNDLADTYRIRDSVST